MIRVPFIILVCSMLMLAGLTAHAQGRALSVITLGATTVIGIGNLVMLFLVADPQTKSSNPEDKPALEGATGFQAGAFSSTFIGIIASLVNMFSVSRGNDQYRIAAPVTMTFAGIAAIFDGIAGWELDKIVGKNPDQRANAHALAIADYVLAGVCAATLVPPGILLILGA